METLYPDERPQVKRHSSLDQYKGFFAVQYKGGWTPLVFDQLDSISCETVKTHPVVISFTNDIGYHFSDAECSYTSDKFIYFDIEEEREEPLPACMGGTGEMYIKFLRENAFINFDNGTSLGTHNISRLRVGTDYVLSDETLPPAD